MANGADNSSDTGAKTRERIFVDAEQIRYVPDQASQIRLRETDATIRRCVIAAALIGLLPLPFSDAPFLIITQFIMLKKLCAKYGREPGWSLALIVAAAIIGPLAFTALAKRLPFAGSIIGACIAGAITWYMGKKVRAMLEAGLPFTLRAFFSVSVAQKD